MNVGFQPRLRARSSLYDLIAYRSIERRSVGAGSPIPVDDLPPLPVSASPSPISPSLELATDQDPELEAQPSTMASKKATKAANNGDVEEQYGEFEATTVGNR